MTLPASGAISLNQMHVEVGGSSGSTASINDTDIRALIGKSSGATMAFNEWYGATQFVADRQIDLDATANGAKYAVNEFTNYTGEINAVPGTVSGCIAARHDNAVIYTQGGSTYYIHSTNGGTLNNLASFEFNTAQSISGTSPNGSGGTYPWLRANGGGGSANFFDGKYWRLPSTYTDGTSTIHGGNHLISNGSPSTKQAAFGLPIGSGNPPATIFTGFGATITFPGPSNNGSYPLGYNAATKRVVIQIY
tara:strand:+ start:465 stop:1214 length:750 start_codon:yes stop_codon:yes gene_type:complete